MKSNKIANAFNRAASHYDYHGILQRKVALVLADKIIQANIIPSEVGKILEIGCGTGFLTEPVLKAYPTLSYDATDISSAMVQHCSNKLPPSQHLRYFVMDGEEVSIQGHWNTIISNLTFQWFQDLEHSLQRLWEKTDSIAFSILLDGTLREWKDICARGNLKAGIRAFKTLTEVEKLCIALNPSGCSLEVSSEKQTFPNGLAFLRNLKGVGAHIPADDYSPVSLKNLLNQNQGPLTVSYEVLYGIIKR